LNEESVNIIVKTEDSGRRLDAFLAEAIDIRSRSQIQKMIEGGDVLVNQKESKASHKLRVGDEIDVEITEIAPATFAPEDIPIDIVYEDDSILVVNKSAGMVVHPGAGISSGTLANAVAYHFGMAESETSGVAGDIDRLKARVGIVHRLDKLTSGLILIAKTEDAHEKLSEQFRNRTVFKDYLTLVHGEMLEESGIIDAPIARERHNRTKMGVRAHGRHAISLWRIRRRFEKFTLLGVEIKTGRTHQIRVHLAHINHPVVGDEVYNSGRDKTVGDHSIRKAIAGLGRFFLHAEKLAFDHPATGERMKFTVPLPGDLSEFLELLDQ